MRIAIVSTFWGLSWGGSEYLWSVMAKQALAESHEVFISIDCLTKHPLINKIQQQGAQLFLRQEHLQTSLLKSKIKRLIFVFPFLTRLLLRSSYQQIFNLKPDVICISQSSTYDLVYEPELLNLLKLTSIPFLIINQFNSDTCFLDNTAQQDFQQLFAKAARVAFISHHNHKLAERQLAQSIPNGIVVQNPVNLAEHSIIPCPSQTMIRFASVARLEVAFKGQDFLFEVLGSSVWRLRNWELRLYGEGSDKYYLEQLAKHYQIIDKVKFMGQVKDIRGVWNENHLLVLPSRGEGTPLALIEAMICGRPSVVTDVGGNAEWVDEPQTGFIAEAPNAKSFGAALERAWSAKNDWEKIGIQAHKAALLKFDQSPGDSLLKLLVESTK